MLRAEVQEAKEKARTDVTLVAAELEQARRDAAAHAQRFAESEVSTAEWRLRAGRAERVAAQLQRAAASIDAAVLDGEQRLGIGVGARQNPGSASSTGSADGGGSSSTRRQRSRRARSSESSRSSLHVESAPDAALTSSAHLRMASRSSPGSRAARLRHRGGNHESEDEDASGEEQDSEEEEDAVATVTKRLRYTPDDAQARTGKRRRRASAGAGTSRAHAEIIDDDESEDGSEGSATPESPQSSGARARRDGGQSVCITM